MRGMPGAYEAVQTNVPLRQSRSEWEFWDVQHDSHEMNNLYMKKELARLRKLNKGEDRIEGAD